MAQASPAPFEQNDRFFQQLAKTMPGVLFVYDLLERRNVYVNQGGWTMLGYTEDEFLSMADRFLATTLHPEDLARLPQLAEEYARAVDGQVFTHLFRMRHKNGTWRWVQRNVSIFAWTAEGRPRQLVGTSTDVTEIRNAQEEARDLSTRLLSAQDQERSRIARELHDTTAQNLSVMSMQLDRLKLEEATPSVAQVVAECQRLCDASLREIRTLSYLLHPPMLDEVGLVSAVRWFVDGLESRSGLGITLDAPSTMERLPAAMERDLYSIVQEALLNVVRHSGSETAEVRLERQATDIVLQIQDTGRGLAGTRSPESPGDGGPFGVGIPSMRERARAHGGGLAIQSNHLGTTITARVPLHRDIRLS